MKVLCVFGRFAYGDSARGEGYEHANFLPALRANGWEVVLFDSWDRSLYSDFSDLNRRLIEVVRLERPQVVLCVPMQYEIWTDTLDLIRQSPGTSVVVWGTDDSWKFDEFTRFIAPHADVYATTYESAVERGRGLGLENFVLTQWAIGNDRLHPPLPSSECRYPVSFVGAAYGNRRAWISALQVRGINVRCFGHGWDGGVLDGEAMMRVVRESVISLNFADSPVRHFGGSRHDRQLKARTFEVPGCGGFLLTETVSGIEKFYVPDQEISVFGDLEDLVARIQCYLARDEERDRIANAGYRRTAKDHTYEKRFVELFSGLAASSSCEDPGDGERPGSLSSRFEAIAGKHRRSLPIRAVGFLMVAACSLLLGPKRGPRAARRLLYELSWRICGRRTYSAAGWPGRMFYSVS